MIKVATDLMQGLWIQARALHLDESTEDVSYLSLGSPRSVFEALGVPHHILYETFQPLAYDGEPAEVIAQFPWPGATEGDGPDASSSPEARPTT
jgi:hypothetical protein